MAQLDGELLAAFSTPVVQGWLDGSGERYSDDEQLMALADGLDNCDVSSAVRLVVER